MKHLRCVLSVVVTFSMMVTFAEAQAPSQNGANVYPQNDAQSKTIRQTFPRPANITKRMLRGDVIARGSKVRRNRGQGVTTECDYDFGVRVELMSGRREYTLQPNESDCTVTLADLQDTNVVEPTTPIASTAPTPRGLIARFFQALFPTLEAQSWQLKQVYHHIYSCGVACAGGADGLTAQQGWLNFRHNTSGGVAEMQSASGWFCTAGTGYPIGTSLCQPPMNISNAPMVPVNTGWVGQNFWITGRLWGGYPPAAIVFASDQVSFFHQSFPGVWDHTLYVKRWGYWDGRGVCDSYHTGSVVNGPVKGLCVVTPR